MEEHGREPKRTRFDSAVDGTPERLQREQGVKDFKSSLSIVTRAWLAVEEARAAVADSERAVQRKREEMDKEMQETGKLRERLKKAEDEFVTHFNTDNQHLNYALQIARKGDDR